MWLMALTESQLKKLFGKKISETIQHTGSDGRYSFTTMNETEYFLLKTIIF